jgi:DNA-binding NarL/FixJ family response regulator
VNYPGQLPGKSSSWKPRGRLGWESDRFTGKVHAAVRAAFNGEVHLDAAVARKLTQSLIAPRNNAAALTAREREILTYVAQGKSNREIAGVLVLSERTVRTHVSNLLAKLGLASRTQAALWAVKEGVAPAP